MLEVRNNRQRSMLLADCPYCGARMRLATVEPAVREDSGDRITFDCRCGAVLARDVKPTGDQAGDAAFDHWTRSPRSFATHTTATRSGSLAGLA